MNCLTEYVHKPGKANKLLVLVDGELARNERETSASSDLSEGERTVLLNWIRDARSFCAANTLYSMPRDSVLGGTVKKLVYTSLFHDVDFVTLKDTGAFLCSEMKFGLKPNSYGPFARAAAFVSKIAVKFDELEPILRQDSEQYVNQRIILASDEHFELLQGAIEDLKNAEEVCSSDGQKHDYLLCTLHGLVELLANNVSPENTFAFAV